jgi:DNA-binding MarR family transcriptional regulator
MGIKARKLENALSLMRQASLLIRLLEAHFVEQDLSQLRLLILIVIDREPGRHTLTIGEITDRLDVAVPVATRMLKSLGDAGLGTITLDRQDLRTRHVRLTLEGQDKLASVLPGYFLMIGDAMDKPG